MKGISLRHNKDMEKEEGIQESICPSPRASTLLAPVSPLSSHAGDGRPPKPQLPQEESREEPGVNRHFSLNGIDYFCNQHLKLNIHYYRIPKQK